MLQHIWDACIWCSNNNNNFFSFIIFLYIYIKFILLTIITSFFSSIYFQHFFFVYYINNRSIITTNIITFLMMIENFHVQLCSTWFCYRIVWMLLQFVDLKQTCSRMKIVAMDLITLINQSIDNSLIHLYWFIIIILVLVKQ